MKICIITPDIIGPIKNGGIGTYVSTLCQLLKGHQLTVVFTSTIEEGASQHWRNDYVKQGVEIVCLEDLVNRDPYRKLAPWEDWFFERSRRIYEFLESRDFELAHFQDWHANGFISVRARRTGIGLRNTRVAVTMHSPTAWCRQGMQIWPDHVLADMKLDLAERYCCEHTDILLAPSQHMFEWAEQEGWKLPDNRRVLLNPFIAEKPALGATKANASHIIFFGRLETRKGLGIFLNGLRLFLNQHPEHGIERITFLGKNGQHNGQAASELIEGLSQKLTGIEIEAVTNLDATEALEFITQSGGIVFLPSLLDNCPYTVIECIDRGFSFMASSTGGIPELVDSECLFAPTREGVAEALAKRHMDYGKLTHNYSVEVANAQMVSFHNELAKASPVLTAPSNKPLVSICVPFYNHPVYLPQLLASINSIQYPNYEVIVCNDGSSEPQANRVFEEQAKRYERPNWQFFTKENGGVGHTRNAAAAKAKGDYIVFMDADNLARPEMLQIMVDAIQISKADCLTCYFLAFTTDDVPQGENDIEYLYRPIGGGTALGVLENTFGDANFIVRRSVFEAVGGFSPQRETSFEDWEILVKFYLQGYDVDVIPKELFWYRHLESGFSRVTNHYANHQRVLRLALADCPPLQRELIGKFAIPIFYRYLDLERRLGHEVVHEEKSLKPVPWHKYIYRFYRRLIGDPKYSKLRRAGR